MNNPKVAAEWAVQMAELLPERYREAAFSVMLKFALESLDKDNFEPRGGQLSQEKTTISNTNLKKIMTGIPDDEVIATKGNRDQQIAWAIAKLVSHSEEANNTTICEIIKTILAINPPTRQNTNRSLRYLVPKYVIREKKKNGRGYSYIPSVKITQIFEGLE